MKVYRKNIFIINHVSELPVKQIGNAWYNPSGHKVALHQQINTVIHTGANFEGYTNIRTGFNIQANSYYRFDGTKKARSRADQNLYAKWTNISAEQASALGRIAIFNIMEGTYTGKDMGERSIVATIDFPSRIDFQIGDYVEFEIANLERTTSIHGGSGMEKFYIYTMPTVKKVASRLSFGKAFQHTVTFYPCQYELATVKMRDVLQDISSGVIYTGYDEFSFYGGANTLMKRIMAVLDERFGHTGVAGKDYWSYQIADSINEDRNTALEKFQFDFSDSNVMEALLKLNDAEGINTKFFINERMIYVGFKRPYIVGVDEHNLKRDIPFEFAYGKTSHLPIETNHGNLYTITKSNGSASPITRLYAYGAERNLQRFYCSDRIKTGRYVNKLMLPSFEDDGRTDYIDSPEGIARFGILEGTKTFDNIYPSLRFFYYGNLRDVKYCIKLMGSGLQSDSNDPEHVPADTYGIYDGGTTITKANVTPEQIQRAKEEVDRTKGTSLENETRVTITIDGVNYSLSVTEADQLINKGSIRIGGVKSGRYHYPIARIQCYKVVDAQIPKRDEQGNIIYDSNNNPVTVGLNKLVECQPPVDIAVFCHATGKVVKCVLYGGATKAEACQKQYAADGKIPTTDGNAPAADWSNCYTGACFAVHDGHPTESNKHFECGHLHPSLAYPGLPNSDQRAAWFTDADSISTSKDGSFYKPYDEYKNQVSIHQIHYTDDHWITDVYEFTDYHQQTFNRQGYSAYCWPRVNKYYPNSQADNIEVNAVVDVGPVLIEDTDLNTSMGQQQQTFDIYMRDMGFKINDQTWFGDKCFLFDTCKISFLDGNLGGYEFEMPAESDQDKLGSIYVPALAPDGTRNPEFFDLADNPAQAEQAYLNGAFWRIVAKRAETEVDRYWVPNVNLNASAGDHVVFLDIFMPDLYIRVAEQRLYKEAKKYLDANDDGDIQYSFDFDKVRMLKQPTFPLQMREGAIMRVIDDDLDVGTVNAQKTVFEDKNGLVTMTSLVKLTATVDEGYEIITRDCDYIEAQQLPQATFSKSTSGRITKYFLTFKRSAEDNSMDFDIESGVSIRLYSAAKVQRHEGGGHTVLEWYCWNYKAAVTEIVSAGINGYRAEIPNLLSLDSHAIHIDPDQPGDSKVYVGYSVRKQTLTPVYDESVLPIGRQIFCVANSLTDFKCSKHYEIEMDILEPDLLVEDTPSKKQMFALVNGLGDGETFYYPDYTAVDITPEGETFKRFRISFDLPQDFSDEKDYYPAFLCASDGVTEAIHVRLWSIVERDDAAMEDLNYVDLAIDSVTIKFHDNTREKDVSLQDGQEPERLRDNLSEMSREVSATVKEESRATAWAQLMDRMTEAEQLQDQTLDFYQSLVDASRKHYLELLNLKNNIFDPDGTCKETFLQIMMLQVGADSMNYQLKYTHYSMNGHMANCGLRFDTDHPTTEITDPVSGKAYIDSFFIGNAEEVLDHYVYTENPTNGEGGRWYPQERNTLWPLHKVVGPDGTDIYPVYFIALKASLTNPQDCHWVCEPTQHATNELVDAPNTQDRYFYFNWGILAPVTDNDQDPDYGKYTLTETRGNAYMYGDNLICGQISTLAGNSYFDLTHGNFVLSKDGPDNQDKYHDGLEYRNGVLIIHGLSDSEGLGKTIKDLGLEIEDMEIGGDNLLFVTEYNVDDVVLDGNNDYDRQSIYLTYYYGSRVGPIPTLFSPGTYVFSAEDVWIKIQDDYYFYDMELYLYAWNQTEDDDVVNAFVKIPEGKVKDIIITTTKDCYFQLYWKTYWTYDEQSAQQEGHGSFSIKGMQLQKGRRSTAYNEYIQHLTDALHGSTEIAGGLVMANLLMLKDENGDVKAGMSGLTDDSAETGNESEGVTLWSGGAYAEALEQAQAVAQNAISQLTKVLPVLITKTGKGSKIGCFNVVDENAVEIYSSNGRIRIDTSYGIQYYDSNDILRLDLSQNDITMPSTTLVSIENGHVTAGSGVAFDLLLGSVNLSTNVLYKCSVQSGSKVKMIFDGEGTDDGYHGTCRIYLKNTRTNRIIDLYNGTWWGNFNTTGGAPNGTISPQPDINLGSVTDLLEYGTWQLRAAITDCKMIWAERDYDYDDHITSHSKEAYFYGKLTFASTVDKRCIRIGANGMIIQASDANMIAMFNDNANVTDIRMVGLPQGDPGVSGQVYVLNGALRIH